MSQSVKTRLVATTLAAASLLACGPSRPPASPLSPTPTRTSAGQVASATIANPFAAPRDTLAACLAGSGQAACFTAAAWSPASAPAISPLPNCANGEGGASCFGRSRLEAVAAADLVAPSALAGTVSGTTVTLSWTAPAAGDAATFYVIEAGSAPGLSNLASLSTGNAATTFAATGVPAGLHHVRVRAANAAGAGPPSNEVVLQVGGPAGCGPLGTPTLSLVTNSGGRVGFSWTIPSGGPTAYILQAGSASGLSNLANLDLRQASPTFTTTGVPQGTYYVRVLARRNDCARSAPSNELIVAVSGGPPPGSETSGVKMLQFDEEGCPISPPRYIVVDGTLRGRHGEFIGLNPGPHSYVLCTTSSTGDVCGPSQTFTVILDFTYIVYGGNRGFC